MTRKVAAKEINRLIEGVYPNYPMSLRSLSLNPAFEGARFAVRTCEQMASDNPPRLFIVGLLAEILEDRDSGLPVADRPG